MKCFKNLFGWVAQLVKMSSQYTKVVGSFPCQGTYKNQPMTLAGLVHWIEHLPAD